MAILKVNGTVERIFQDGRCVKLVEKSTSGDKEYTSRYTAWFEQSPGLVEGQTAAVSGFISVKQGKPWEDRDGNQRTSIDVNINKAKLDTKGEPVQAAPKPSDEPWASTAGPSFPAPAGFDFPDETPF